MTESTFNFERKLLNEGYSIVIGVDEAGRGPLAGPVVAAAVVLKRTQAGSGFYHLFPPKDDEEKNWNLVRDSKKLSEKQREKIFDFVHENFHVGIGLCDHKTIDRINILEASFLAMKKAIAALKKELRDESLNCRAVVVVDGNKKIPNFSMEQKAIIGGDKIIKSISAASIIAKVTRDRMMLEMHKKYFNYGFDQHKGYGTELHFKMLQKHGPCEIHRKSFAPVLKLVKKGKK